MQASTGHEIFGVLLDRLFEGEIRALAHPRAALLIFSPSLIAYNELKLTRPALAAVHGKESKLQEKGA